VEVSDLPPGRYALTAKLTGTRLDSAMATAFFSVYTGPFDAAYKK
jgi:hypothetical protein